MGGNAFEPIVKIAQKRVGGIIQILQNVCSIILM
jgi:hypothetical protein